MFDSPRQRLGVLVPLAWAVLCAVSAGQVAGPNNVGNFPGMLPGQAGMFPGQSGGMTNTPGNQVGLTPQMQQYMMLRALQGAGHHHGVQTGMSNPIFGAGPQFDPSAAWTDDGGQQTSSGRTGSSDKRAAIRLAREQQKQLARERAETKKAKAPTKAGKPKFNAS